MSIDTTNRRLGGTVLAVALAMTFSLPAPALAQSDLLKQGMDLLGKAGGGSGGSALSEVKIGEGLKEALKVASSTVVKQLGQSGGYLNDAAAHIELPGFLGKAQSMLKMAGQAGLLDDLEVRLNRAAELAAPYAETVFYDAIGEMTVADAQGILTGPEDSATEYFRRTMGPKLKELFRPIVEQELQEAGAISAFNGVVDSYGTIPFAPDLADNAQTQLVDHGLDGALDGLFHYIAEQEKAIRTNPAARTTELLKEVFG